MSSRIENFINKVSLMSCSVLFLSLFDDMENLHFVPNGIHNFWSVSIFDRKVRQLLLYGNGHITLDDMDGEIRHLLSSLVGSVAPGFVFSAASHVFWYSILDDMDWRSQGTYRIGSRRGRLMYEGQAYDSIAYDYSAPGATFKGTSDIEGSVTSATQDLWASAQTQWQVTAREGMLYGSLVLFNRRDPEIVYGWSNPTAVFERLAIVLVNCEHPTDSRTENWISTPGFTYVIPEHVRFPEGSVYDLRIYAVVGIVELQIFCLGFIANCHKRGTKVVMRQSACHACCIRASEENEIHILIL
ncbi:hypothetical protein GGR55DRAFT_697720 [Xylaria sp. FL0064]|nr:hypothetical protein GGR55DRAFT_697720 [Xylaria sp. FL0064]